MRLSPGTWILRFDGSRYLALSMDERKNSRHLLSVAYSASKRISTTLQVPHIVGNLGNPVPTSSSSTISRNVRNRYASFLSAAASMLFM
jgi:hypothetical protein